MGIIGWYILFALTTAFAALYELVGPVLRQIEASTPEDNLIKNKVLSYTVFFGLSVLCAPLLIIACIVPSTGEAFRRVLLQSLVG